MIIINNDDFGYSPDINKATYIAFQQGLISSTTALVNFEEGLKDAVSYTKENKISPRAIGVHLNLSEGVPLTNNMKKNHIFCDAGVYKGKKAIPELRLDSNSMDVVYDELEEQLNHFENEFGFKPSHIDSHHHTHTKWPILKNVIKLAKKKGIKSIRISRNIEKGGSIKKRIYKTLINSYLKILGFNVVDKFGDIDELIKSGIFNSTSNFEAMVHVNMSADGKTIIDIDKKQLQPKLNKLFKDKSVKLINYNDL